MKEKKVCIIGAGVAGLVAALELEKSGFSPLIIEASDAVGGRIRTDQKDGFLFDRGFQVLLTAYPEAKHYLDYDALKLQNFKSGAIILKPGDIFKIADPLRDPSQTANMLFSKVGTFGDKWKMFRLSQKLKKKSLEEIFAAPSIPTNLYLKQLGFSDKIINLFFKPFFRGIFLENELETSSRMFEFVFKMFAEGATAIPENGMQEIPKQLASKLLNSHLRFHTKVSKIEPSGLVLEDGEIIPADEVIIACQPDKILPQLKGEFGGFQNVVNLYFSLHQSFLAENIIGLIPDETFLINNLVFMTDVSKAYAPKEHSLLSVSIVKDVAEETNLLSKVTLELEVLSGIKAEHFKHLRTYVIEKALPKVDQMRYDMAPSETRVRDNIYLAGDYLLYGSLNAAMLAGRKAAQAVILNSRL
ncbi:NAD(P)/FAD-dependent oxidoreductase [Pararhodonellum marinum]|uniref:NAD(P)/FAD-dependent oxidoreductase n=1 Tax=Pararhodonellum marinum TaxID=2755358 RepID=UPI001890699E|nr:NAD(P)/FAD-dependent oxidoreductase [Pararhodonellum marinum]